MVLYDAVTKLRLRKPLHYLRKIRRISSSCSSRQDGKLDKSASSLPRNHITFFFSADRSFILLNSNMGDLGNEWGRD